MEPYKELIEKQQQFAAEFSREFQKNFGQQIECNKAAIDKLVKQELRSMLDNYETWDLVEFNLHFNKFTQLMLGRMMFQ